MSELAREMTYQELSEAYTQRLRERDQFHAERDNCLKDIEKLRVENKNLKELNKFLEMKLESVENTSKSEIDSELDFVYKNWRAALSMGNSIAEEKFKVDMENLKLKEEIERLQNKLME